MRISYRQAPLATRKDMTACVTLTHVLPIQHTKACRPGRRILSPSCANHANDVRFTAMPDIPPHYNTGCTYPVLSRVAELLRFGHRARATSARAYSHHEPGF